MRLVRTDLALARVAAGYETAAKAAEALAVSRMHLLNIERGRCGASDELFERMSALYQVRADWLKNLSRRAQRELLTRKLKQIA